MIVLIPLGGVGQRFKSYGYKKPKALIHVYGNHMGFTALQRIVYLIRRLCCAVEARTAFYI